MKNKTTDSEEKYCAISEQTKIEIVTYEGLLTLYQLSRLFENDL